MKGRGGSSSGKGGSPGGARVPRESGDNNSGSDSILGSPEPHGDVLGRPTVDPWYRSSERFPSVPASLQPPPADWEWLVLREGCYGRHDLDPKFPRDSGPPDSKKRDACRASRFCDRLEQAGVLRSILISRCSNMFRDTEALRQLVRRWCPSTHTFFFAHGELTVTLEDVENHWLLPILGDQDPAEIALSPEESKIEAVLADYIGRKNVALGTQAARFNSWMEHFLRIEDPLIRRAGFHIVLAQQMRVRFPLAPLLLGQLYTQLDLLHAEELAGASCHIVSTAFNSSVVHTFVWEHALEYIRKGKKPYEIRKKFASMPEGVVTNVGDFQGDVPAVFRWVGNKFYDHSLIPSLDSEGKVCWRPYGITHRGFVYESVMSGFRDVEAQDYTLIAGDVASLTYLSATNAGWLPVLSVDGPQFTIYSAHRVRRQFGFDQEVPAVMGVAADSGREDISHLLESYTSPLPHPRLFGATNTMTTYANRQSLGYAVWHHEDSRWVIYGNHHPPLWLRDHPHIAAPGKVPSSRGKRNVSAGTPTAIKRKQPDRSKKGEAVSKDSPAQASKRVKTTAGRVSKEALVLKTAVQDPVPADETAAGRGAPASIAARVAARKSGRGIVYFREKTHHLQVVKMMCLELLLRRLRMKMLQAATAGETESESAETTAAAETESEGVEAATAAETESESAEAAAAEAVSGAGDFTADISSPDIGSLDTDAIINASSEEKDVEAGASIEDDEVSMGELGATGAASDSGSTASASKTMSAEEVIEEHVTVGVVTGAERVVEPTPITVTSSGGTVQGDVSESGSHVDPSLLDSSPSTRQYVRRARRGSLVSTDSERTASITARVPTPPSPLGESGGTAPTPIITAAVVSAAATVQGDETAPVITEEVPGHARNMARVEPAEVAASEEPVQADVTPGSGVPVIEEELAQDPVDDVDMADTHDSYDEAWADAEDNMAGDQAADMEVTAPVAAQISPTRTARSESWNCYRGRRKTLGCSSGVCQFEHTSFSSRHAEHFWTFDDAKADFEVFRVPRGGIRFLKALWEKLGDITEVHILEWKAVVQEAIEGGGSWLSLREAEARVAALRDALNAVAPKPMGLGFCQKSFCRSSY
uniref:Aminotransferase-like plant mobile domain-containing protein n=1 Tax=Fagus sylvatica TaxID=28930 RepID=A0A2N9EVM6_FAGSY